MTDSVFPVRSGEIVPSSTSHCDATEGVIITCSPRPTVVRLLGVPSGAGTCVSVAIRTEGAAGAVGGAVTAAGGRFRNSRGNRCRNSRPIQVLSGKVAADGRRPCCWRTTPPCQEADPAAVTAVPCAGTRDAGTRDGGPRDGGTRDGDSSRVAWLRPAAGRLA